MPAANVKGLHAACSETEAETDAPDQCLPPERVWHPLPAAADGKPVNHPANLAAVYQFAAELFETPLPELAGQVEANFLRVFGGLVGRGLA